MHTKFSTLFKQRLARQPDVQAIITKAADEKHRSAAALAVSDEKAEADKAAAVAAGVKDFKEGVAESRKTNPPNPIAGMGPGAAGSAIPPEGAPEEAPGPPKSAFDLRRDLKAGAREDARRHLPA